MRTVRYTHDAEDLKDSLAHVGGRVVHDLGGGYVVVDLPLGALAMGPAMSPLPMGDELPLAPRAWMAMEARRDDEDRVIPGSDLPWNAEGREAPADVPPSTPDDAGSPNAPQASTGTPTSLYLCGSVAVAIVLVSGPDHLALDDDDQVKIVSEVQEALDFLADAEPRAKLSFVHEVQVVQIGVAPGTVAPGDAYERKEAPWRDAALAQLGYAAGRAGYGQLVRDLKAKHGTDWAYVAFFTQYELNHFAYAIDEKVVMHVENDGWGRDNIHRVFAHESCHIFGAADEYGACSCGSRHGYLAERNGNCVACFPPGKPVDCLMNANTLAFCAFTRRQIGWDPALFPSAPPLAGSAGAGAGAGSAGA